MIPLPATTLSRLREMLDAGARTSEIATALGIAESSVRRCRLRMGFEPRRAKAIDYVSSGIDAMLLDGIEGVQIAARTGISPSTISKRRTHLAKIGVLTYRLKNTTNTAEPAAPMIDIRERLNLALQAKARRLGQPISWVRETWLHGPAGREFLREYRGMGC